MRAAGSPPEPAIVGGEQDAGAQRPGSRRGLELRNPTPSQVHVLRSRRILRHRWLSASDLHLPIPHGLLARVATLPRLSDRPDRADQDTQFLPPRPQDGILLRLAAL